MPKHSHTYASSDSGLAINGKASELARAQHLGKRPHRALRVAGGMILLAAVLGVAFLGHLSPDMQLQWENLMALCGF